MTVKVVSNTFLLVAVQVVKVGVETLLATKTTNAKTSVVGENE